LATPRTLAEVDLTAITKALAAVETADPGKPREDRRREVQLERELAAATARIEALERDNRDLNTRLAEIAALAAGAAQTLKETSDSAPRPKDEAKPVRPLRVVATRAAPVSIDGITRRHASCWSRWRNMRPGTSPGVRRRHSPASSRVAGISMPGARNCETPNMSLRGTVWSRRLRKD
jgi:hypothetical protein